jgi:tetratricopeptide (TPR) repeat protein
MRTAVGAVEKQAGRRVLLLTIGPVVGVTIGALTNVLTSHWNWWLFSTLTALICVAAVVAVALDGATGNPIRRDARSAIRRRSQKQESPGIDTLPGDDDHFIGRQDEISRLSTMIDGAAKPGGSRTRVYSVEGIGGVGKTSLAVHIAHQVANCFPDAVLYIDLRAHVDSQKPITASEALATLLSNLGVPGEIIPDSLEGRKALWRRELAGARALVILDNASGPDYISDMLTGGDQCLFIITSRQKMAEIDGVYSLPLETLPSDDAITLFGRLLGTEPVGQQKADIAEVVRRIGCLPLAIMLTAARLRKHPTWTIDDLLADVSQNTPLERVCALSYEDLEPRQKAFFLLLSVHPGAEITAQTAAVLTGTSVRAAADSLEELYNRYLLAEPSPRRFKFHDLIKDFAIREGSEMSEAKRQEALLRLLGYYSFMTESASEMIGMHDLFTVAPPSNSTKLDSITDDASALNWLDTELGNLLACAYYANSKAVLPSAWQLPASLTYYLRLRGLLVQAMSLLDVALQTLEHEPDRFGEATVRRRVGQLARLQGHSTLSRRQLDKSMQLTRELGDRQGLAWCHHELAHLDRLNGDLTGARNNLTAALEINRDLGNRAGIAAAETYLGTVLHSSGDYEQAREYLEDSLRLSNERADRRAQAAALYHLGALKRDSGNYVGAREMLDQALTIYDRVRNRQGQAECHLNLAMIDRLTDSYEPAARHLSEALGTYVELGYRRGEADTYAELAATAEAAGDQTMSIVHRQRADTIYAELVQS